MGIPFDYAPDRPEYIENILNGLDRYNPETTTVFQDRGFFGFVKVRKEYDSATQDWYHVLIHGGIEAGPNAVLAFAREGYRKTDFKPGDLFDALSYGGFWRFLRKYPSMAWYELRRSFSRELFCRSLQRLVPEIRPT